MLYTIRGELIAKKEGYVVINVSGVGFKIALTKSVLNTLPKLKDSVQLFTHLNVKEDALELFGFNTEEELFLFESLISVNGVGPRSAISIMGVANYNSLCAAINSGKPELLAKAGGVGKKTAQRIALELKGKIDIKDESKTVSLLETDLDLEETLVSLGYNKADAREIIGKIDPKISAFTDRLKEALKHANKKALK